MLTVIVMLAPLWNHVGAPLPSHTFFDFFYLNNWFDPYVSPDRLPVVGHFWSLAVEEQFYLLWPLCVWFTPRRYLLRVCVGGILLTLIVRCCIVAAFGPSNFLYEATFARADALLVGALCVFVARNERLLSRIRPLLGFSAVVIVTGTFAIAVLKHQITEGHVKPYMQTVGFSLLALGFGALVIWTYANDGSAAGTHRVLRSRPLTAVGKYSYGMYVYHLPVIFVALRIAGKVHLPVTERISVGAFYVIAVFLATFFTAKPVMSFSRSACYV